jgi:hypothetical protein
VAARTFEDSAGIVWEVFEVHRASEVLVGVSAGLEKGWLAFVSKEGKRRLAPFPAAWETASVSELEKLCNSARRANPPMYPPGSPRIVRTSPAKTTGAISEPSGPRRRGVLVEEPVDSPVRDAVRAFAHEARANKLQAIEAMVRLKSLLAERYSGADVTPATRAEASDLRRVRRWFVEAYYFDRRA